MSFLFTSKLVPLFFYPLGLACLLLLLALLLSWKRLGLPQFLVALALAILWLGSNAWVSNFLVKSLEWQNIPSELPASEAIVLLGGATRSASMPRPMVDISEQGDRVIYAAKLYRDGLAPLIIASGGRITWKSGGQPEAKDMAQLLELFGVPRWAIVQEPDSLNTYENAVNVGKILKARGIDRVLLVTSAMHMPRSLLIFKHQGIAAIAAPTDFLVSKQELAELTDNPEGFILNILPNVENLDRTTKAIKEYIGTIVYRLKGWL